MAEVTWNDAVEVADVFAAIKHIDACDEGDRIILKTPEDGLLNLGSRYWLAVSNKLANQYPHHKIILIVDGADQAGMVQGALADGLQHVRFAGDEETHKQLQSIAEQYGAMLVT